MVKYIVAGPCEIGNVFELFGLEAPEGKFAIVSDGKYADEPGHPHPVGKKKRGPSTVDGKMYASRQLAEENLATAERPTIWAGGREGRGYW